MPIGDNMEKSFEYLNNFGHLSRFLLNLSTIVGATIILISFVKSIKQLYEGFRLYVCSQLCCKANFRRYGQWAVISGATDGIGLSMAKEFARRGLSIVVIGRNKEKLASTKLLLEAEANVGQVLTVEIDLSDSSLDNFARIQREIDPDNRDIGVLVNNAGVMSPTFERLHHVEMKALRDMANVNMLATVYLTRMVLPGMVARGRGLVLNVSSISGCIPFPHISIYGPTKVFVNAFSENLQIEYASHPVDIIYLTPGAVDTNLVRNALNVSETSIFLPTSDYYVKSVLNAVSTRYRTFSGTIFHGLTRLVSQFGAFIGLTPFCMRIFYELFGKNYTL